MAEPMSEDHLKRLEALLKHSPGILWEGLNASEVGDVRACLAELKQVRAQLAEIGETREEWGVRRTWNKDAEVRVGYAICETEEHARSALEHYLAVDRFEQNPVECALVKRLASDWREAPNA